jgi:hypothetical protein
MCDECRFTRKRIEREKILQRMSNLTDTVYGLEAVDVMDGNCQLPCILIHHYVELRSFIVCTLHPTLR